MSNYFNGNGTIGFTCDVCGRELNSCSVVNGMKFCAKCYQETFGKDNQQNEIQELKQQLEEKDNLIEFGKEEIRKRNKRIDEIVERDKKLFAEKNKEIERLKNARNSTSEQVKNWKHEFAISELEKVKMLTEWKFNNIVEVREYLDQQIKELKGE